eukprot:SAG11_NODE_11388_length_764_cov_0.718797_1_plen_138_part_00
MARAELKRKRDASKREKQQLRQLSHNQSNTQAQQAAALLSQPLPWQWGAFQPPPPTQSPAQLSRAIPGAAKTETRVCHKCNQPGHLIRECPLWNGKAPPAKGGAKVSGTSTSGEVSLPLPPGVDLTQLLAGARAVGQ